MLFSLLSSHFYRIYRGWVAENQIFPLTADTIESKIEKAKLKSDSDYKASLVESVAVLRSQGQTLTGEVVTAIDGFKTVSNILFM